MKTDFLQSVNQFSFHMTIYDIEAFLKVLPMGSEPCVCVDNTEYHMVACNPTSRMDVT